MNENAIDDVVRFWFEELTPKQWYRPPETVDAEIAARFRKTYDDLKQGVPAEWLETPKGFLATILVLDQLPRNMFRGQARAFATDKEALALAKRAIEEGIDANLPPKQRAFIYLPFQHSEALADQARSVGLFPHRNAALGRHSTPEEDAFLTEPGSSF
jgi:uncharacterized protein (DUF924 family)